MASSLTKIASAFVAESRSQLKSLATLSPLYKRLANTKPKAVGWYAIQKDCYADDEHTAAHWSEGKFWIYGSHGPLRVRREVEDVTRWRKLTAQERKTWELPDSDVERFTS